MNTKLLLALFLVVSIIPFADAAHQGTDIDKLPYPKAECISGTINGACDVAEAKLANGTMFVFAIDNSFLHRVGPEPTQAKPQTQTNSVSNNNDGGDDEGAADKTYCDVPNPSNPCHDRRDVSETTGLATCMDGSHEKDWRDCNGDNNSNNDDSAAADEPAQDGGCQKEDTYCDADENCRSESVDCIDDRGFDEDDYNG